MKAKINTQPQKRRKEIKLLEAYITNPGRFSILILGDRGTGKKKWINTIFDKYKPKDAPDKAIIINSIGALPSTEYWTKQFDKANKGILLVNDVEQLSKENQEILFDGIGTQDGKYGFNTKEYEIRIIFTSSLSIAALRDTEKYLTHKFFDRIAQLVVRFPNFNECANTISKDFKITWSKFEFKEVPYPEALEHWLQTNAQRLHGNFRDLDKLCIVWNNYQLMGYSEDVILKNIKNDFFEYYRFPEANKEDVIELHFSREESYQNALHDFKSKYKAWAKKEFGSLKKADPVVGKSYRTMEGW